MFQFRRFPTYTYLIQCTLTEYCSAGFPHSEIHGSRLMCSSPWLIAACHVLRRLLMPRHSPCALFSLTYRIVPISKLVLFVFRIMQAHRRIYFAKLCFTLNELKVPHFLSFFVITHSSVTPLCCLAYHFHSLCSVFKVQD